MQHHMCWDTRATWLKVRTTREEAVSDERRCEASSVRCAFDEVHAEPRVTPYRGMQQRAQDLHLAGRPASGGEALYILHAIRFEAALPCLFKVQRGHVVREAVHEEYDSRWLCMRMP